MRIKIIHRCETSSTPSNELKKERLHLADCSAIRPSPNSHSRLFAYSLSLSPYRFDVELRRFEHITKIRQITFSSSTTTSVCGSLWMRVPHQSGMSECRKRRNANFHKSFQFTLTHSSHFSVLYMSRFSIRFSNEINLSRARKINVNNTKNEQNVLKILWNR